MHLIHDFTINNTIWDIYQIRLCTSYSETFTFHKVEQTVKKNVMFFEYLNLSLSRVEKTCLVKDKSISLTM